MTNETEVYWYNDTPLAIEEQLIRIKTVRFYPNPVSDVMYIDNEVGMQELKIINLLGQTVIQMQLDNRRSYRLNTGSLERGVYIIYVSGDKGYKGTAKFIKQ